MNTELTPNEVRALLALNVMGPASEEKLAKATGMNVDVTMQAAFMLREKGLVEIDEHSYRRYFLTEEGARYAANDLPERRALRFILDRGGEISMKDLASSLSEGEINIALGWLRNKGWASLEHSKHGATITAAGDQTEGEDEVVLKTLVDKDPLTIGEIPVLDDASEVLSDLIKRNLVLFTEHTERTIRITSEGESFASKGLNVEEQVTQLNSDMIRKGSWKDKHLRKYDVGAPSPDMFPGKSNPYRRILEEMRMIFFSMGFQEIKGDIVQSSFWNFDALFQPQDHPARDMQDTFYLDSEAELPSDLVGRVKAMHENGADIDSTGWGGSWSIPLSRKHVLRTHTTTHTIRYLAENPAPPAKVFCIDRVYRRETVNPTHLPEFDQLEGIVMDKDVSFRNLLGCLSEFYYRMGFEDVRFRPGYFPYTEPSVESDVYLDGLGWIELCGAGVFRKEVTHPFGVEHPVLAWGLGVGRLAMLKLGLSDLRDLYQEDIDWLRRYPVLSVRG